MLRDEITFKGKGGNGGDGIVHWRREKYIPKGGPNGGNGGKGGDVYIKGIRNITALSRLSRNKLYKAEPGNPGGGSNRNGRDGEHIYIEVPIGSIVKNLHTKEIFEVLEEGQEFVIAAGGNGGFGNAHFKSSKNTTPEKCTKGQKGQKYTFFTELQMIADVGIIGLPNAGKSTLLNSISKSNAEIGAYPFTTLEPNLGVVSNFIFADIPGLIEGAAEGVGLGHAFLRHIKRTQMLLHLVSVENENPRKEYDAIRNELGKYDPGLLKKEEMILISKVDTVDDETVNKMKQEFADKEDVLIVSAIDDKLVKEVVDNSIKKLRTLL